MERSEEGAAMRRCNALVTAVRVYPVRRKQDSEGSEPEPVEEHKPPRRRYPREALVFDTETRAEPAQRLLFGVWRLYRDRWDGDAGSTCVEEGIFYPEDIAAADLELLREYVSRHRARVAPGLGSEIRVWPVSRWLGERLWRYGYEHRNRCHVVGFNLPFDLGRLASWWAPAKGYYRGGWSLGLWGSFDAEGNWHDRKWRRRILMRAIDPRRTLFAWGGVKREDADQEQWKGPEARFVDLHTLVFALTDRNYDLEHACGAFGDPFEKAKVTYGQITRRLVAYARDDVAHTGKLYRRCMAELARHPGVDLQPHRLYSPATVGTRYLQAMGVTPPVDRFDLDPRILGWAMSAFFGGRAEARIVRTPVPVAHVDAASMYPTVNALLGTWRLLTAARVETADVTEQVRTLLLDPALAERCYVREFWHKEIGVTLVEVEDPKGAVLPVRAHYDPDAPDPGIGVNPLRYDGTLWYMLPDVIASALLTEDAPSLRVRRAIRLVPHGTQVGLQTVRLRGGHVVDPAAAERDPFVALVEERRRVEADESLPQAERERLGTFLKITANSTAYGVLARFDRRELAVRVKVDAYGPDDEPTEARTKNPEDPGPYCFPPVAASLTAAARLMLAMLEREVHVAGGTYAFCDTDSMAIVATRRGGRVRCRTDRGPWIKALSRPEVESILTRFDELNPYSRALVPALWRVEHDSLDRPLWCYAISAKRYALYRKGRAGPVIAAVVDDQGESYGSDNISEEGGDADGLEDWSEHGLGMYLDPRDPEYPLRDAAGRRVWMREAWEWVLGRNPHAPLPSWANTYALTRFTVSGPAVAAWFSGYDASVPFQERIRPGCFGLIAHPAGFAGLTDDALPTATYESDPTKWEALDWYDRSTGERVQVTTLDPHSDPDGFARSMERGDLPIRTLGAVVASYPRREEHKSLGPDGSRASGESAGLLGRRPVHGAALLTDMTGKEGNRLIERLTGEVTAPEDYRADFGARGDRWGALVLPVLREIGASRLMEGTGRRRSAVFEVLAGRARPSGSRAEVYLRAATHRASERLESMGAEISPDPWGTLYCCTRKRRQHGLYERRCLWCGNPIPPEARTDAVYDSDRCRTAARRARLTGGRLGHG